MPPSPNSFACYQKCCKAFPKRVLGKTQWHPFEIFLRHFKLCLSRNSVEHYWIFSKTFSNCLLAHIHLHGTKKIVKHFHNVSEAKFNRILLKLFQGIFNFCLSLNSVETYLNFSKTFSICVLAQIPLHGTEDVVKYFQNVS